MSETCLSFPENSLVCRICLVAQEVREMSIQEINWYQYVANCNASSPSSSSEMCVCWVCGHLLSKYMRFLHQCQKAHFLLTLVARDPRNLSISSNDKAHNFIHTKPTTDSLPPTVADSYTSNVDVKTESVDAELDRNVPVNVYNERADSQNDLLLNMNSDAGSNILVRDNDERADSDYNNLPLNMNGDAELDSNMLVNGSNVWADSDNGLILNIIIDDDVKDVDTVSVTNTQTGGQTDKPQSAFECEQSDTEEYRGIKHKGPEPEVKEEPVGETLAATQWKSANNDVPNMLNRHQCPEPISKKSMQDYMCYTCNEEFPDWEELGKHVMQHVTLPSVVVSKLPLPLLPPLPPATEPAPPSDGDWCEGEGEDESLAGRSTLPCAVCKAVFPDIIYVEKHVKEKHVPPIQCTKCFTNYPDYSQFKQHVKDGCRHRFKCKFCDKNYGSLLRVQAHENSVHIKKDLYQCDMCQKEFLYKTALISHIKSHFFLKTQALAGMSTLLCAVCNDVFPEIIDVEKHVKEEHVPPIQCTKCFKHYPDYSQFNQHIRDDCRFKCKFCDKIYWSLKSAQAHERSVHTKKDLYQCDMCQKEFLYERALLLHIRKHLLLKTQDKRNDDYHGCAVCNAVFPKMFDVEIHVKEKHVPPIQCTKCSTHYPDYSQFKQHLRDGCLRRFKCKICHKGFGKIDELQHHENSLHTKKNEYQCDLCQKKFMDKNVLRKHIDGHVGRSIKTQGRNTACAVCNDVFPGMNFVYKHVKEKHVPPIQCTECFKHYPDYSQFTKHVRDGCRRRFKCKFCDKSFGKFSNLHIHENAVHTKKIVYECDICQMDFLYRHGLKQHNDVYHPSTELKDRPKLCHYCFVCNAKFPMMLDVEEHVKETHVPPIQCTECSTHYPDYFQFKQHVSDGCRRRFKCKFCDKSYGSLPGVQGHENSQHTKKDVYQCDMCQKEFLYKSQLNRHFKRHLLTDKRKFYCVVCHAEFSKIFDIEKHVREKHVPPIQCTECSKNYPDYSQFKKHVRDGYHRPRRYNCKFCDKTYSTLTGVQTHENSVHTKKNVYSCDICNKQFLNKQNKQRHEDTVHTKKKVYPCGVCQKQFVNKDVHRVHTLTHQKPHLCDLCGKRFTLPDGLKLHKQRKHSK